MGKIRMILDVLNDGKWHTISELTEKLKLAVYEIEARLQFLSMFELAKISVGDGRVKIYKDFLQLPESSTI